MELKIIFTFDEGLTISIIHPAPGISIEQCFKDVPFGAKYKVVDSTVIPTDRMFRDAWEYPVDNTWAFKG